MTSNPQLAIRQPNPAMLWPPAMLAGVTIVAFATLLLHKNMPATVHALHVVYFGAWTYSLDRTWCLTVRRARNVELIAAIGVTAAAVGELIQVWLPNHQVQFRGFVMSVAGVIVGLVMASIRNDL